METTRRLFEELKPKLRSLSQYMFDHAPWKQRLELSEIETGIKDIERAIDTAKTELYVFRPLLTAKAREALVLLDDRGPGGCPDFDGLRKKILEIIGGEI